MGSLYNIIRRTLGVTKYNKNILKHIYFTLWLYFTWNMNYQFVTFWKLSRHLIVLYAHVCSIWIVESIYKLNYVILSVVLVSNNNECTCLIWATTWQIKQSDCAPSEDSGQPGHPPSLIRVLDVCSMGS